MKATITLEVDANESMLATMQRAGFTVVPDSKSARIMIPNAPIIPSRKIKISYQRHVAENKGSNDAKDDQVDEGRSG